MGDFTRCLRSLIRTLVFGVSAVELYKWARRFETNSPGSFRARYLQHIIQRRYGCFLSAKAIIGEGLTLKHPVGIVIGEGVSLGDDVVIYQGVTLGAKKMGDKVRGYPTIGERVVIYAGACVIGSVCIGDGAIIGAGAVVTKDVPSGAVVVGLGSRLVI